MQAVSARIGCATVLLLLCVCGGLEALIRHYCDSFEEDEYVQRDSGKALYCELIPGMGPYTECTEVTDLKSGLKEVFPETRTLCVRHSAPSLPAATFSHLASLEYLHLVGQQLTKMSPGTFVGLTKLRFLSMTVSSTSCLNCSMEEGVFQGLTSLEQLHLIGMCLALAPPNLLAPLVGLNSLKVGQAGLSDIGEVFCLLPAAMKNLHILEVVDNNIAAIRNRGCDKRRFGVDRWPTAVLARIQKLVLAGNPVRIVESDSLSVFKNLSTVDLSLVGTWLGQLWESGLGKVANLSLSSYLLNEFTFSLAEMCTLVTKLGVESLNLYRVSVTDFSVEAMSRCGLGLRKLVVQFTVPQGLDLGFWTATGAIQVLVMQQTHLRNASFCAAGNGTMWNLTSLKLPENQLTDIKNDQFACMHVLEELDLSQNLIATLAPRAFHGLPRLRILRLPRNHLSRLGKHDFQELPALEVLDLNGNRISEGVEEGVFSKQPLLRELTLGRIDIMYEFFISLLFYGFPPKLQRLVLDMGPGTNMEVGQITPPEQPLVLEISANFMESMDCVNSLFPMVRELRVVGSEEDKGAFFGCQAIFLAPFFPNLESLEFWAHKERYAMSFTNINQLRKLKRLKLVNVNFSVQTDPSLTFRNLTQLRSLVLLNCRLNYLTKPMFTDLVSLRLLRLYSESPLVLLEDVFLPLLSLSTLAFDHVDLRCDCSNQWLLDWAEHSPRIQVMYLQRQQCIWHYQKINFLSTMQRLCQTNVDYLFYVATAVCISLVICSSLSYRFLRWPILVLTFRLHGWLRRRWGQRKARRRQGIEVMEEEEEEEEVRFDAFVSFSSHDEEWVMREMAPRLEQEGEPPLRLCLHHRDFEVGKGIVDNIAESINSSRRTVCVLSRRYLRSDWCGLEMRMATHHLLSENSHRLVLVFLERISPFELSAFHRLAKVARTQTYLDWPQDEGERGVFWERLHHIIAERVADELDTSPIQPLKVSQD
ncbi:toll-like receptor 12 [Aplochiton taeniatus]